MAITTYNSTLKEWENIIRVNLKVTNPALLKSGSLGILTNYLAGIKFDALQFYSKAFQEMNVGLAQDFNSLLYHSTIFGADLKFATPSTLTSSIIIPELKLAKVQKLEYFIPKNSSFSDNNSVPFITEADIKIEVTTASINAIAWDKKTGSKKLTVTRAPNPNIPNAYLYLVNNDNIRQYKRTFQSFITNSYDVGDNFEFSTGISDLSQLKEINVWVNTGDRIDLHELDKIDSDDIENIVSSNANYQLEKYQIKFHKFGSSSRDKDIFLEIFENSLNFETGDGLHGIIVPENSQIIVEIQLTLGEFGNVPNSEYIIRNAQITEYYTGTNITNKFETSLNGLSTIGSSGGSSVQTVEEMRSTIMSRINTRNSVVTENDYENMFKWNNHKPFVDAKFIDARAFVFLFNALHENDQVIKSTSMNMKEGDLLADPFYPTQDYNGLTLISPFYYKDSTDNTISAYILNPRLYIQWTRTTDSPAGVDSDIYKIDLAITYDFTIRKSYIEIIDGADKKYSYHFNANQFGVDVVLDVNNGFKVPIDDRYTDVYCVLEEPLTNLRLVVEQDGDILAKYHTDGPIHPLTLKQKLFKYFEELPDEPVESEYPISNQGFAYLDNILEKTISNGLIVEGPENFETYILRMPFMDQNYFYSLPNQEMFEILNRYFVIDYYDDIINYNTQLTQTFHNTIDIPAKYFDFLFEKNKNGVLRTPKIPIKVSVFVDNEAFLTTQYGDTEDLKLDITIFIIKFLKNYEGFMISFFETDLEKAIYNQFAPILRNVKVEQPGIFVVKNSALIYEDIVNNLPFKDVLEFVPPYFYYDYENLDLTLEI